MSVVPWQEAAFADRALRGVLDRLSRDDRVEAAKTVVDVAGVWRIEVDGQGRLVATHGASGESTVLASPPAVNNEGEA